MLAEISTREEADSLCSITTQVVVYEAFRCALPHLDVVLTPNGFGIVNNTNIAPASKERIERLLSSLLINRDTAICQLLTLLGKQQGWLATEQAEFFRGTMFPILKHSQSLQDYMEIREKIIPIEEYIAEQYISKELLSTLRARCNRAASVRISTSISAVSCRRSRRIAWAMPLPPPYHPGHTRHLPRLLSLSVPIRRISLSGTLPPLPNYTPHRSLRIKRIQKPFGSKNIVVILHRR